jgi:hypothetical protein
MVGRLFDRTIFAGVENIFAEKPLGLSLIAVANAANESAKSLISLVGAP